MLLTVAGLVILLLAEAGAFYVPGVAPVEFHKYDPVEVKVSVSNNSTFYSTVPVDERERIGKQQQNYASMCVDVPSYSNVQS